MPGKRGRKPKPANPYRDFAVLGDYENVLECLPPRRGGWRVLRGLAADGTTEMTYRQRLGAWREVLDTEMLARGVAQTRLVPDKGERLLRTPGESDAAWRRRLVETMHDAWRCAGLGRPSSWTVQHGSQLVATSLGDAEHADPEPVEQRGGPQHWAITKSIDPPGPVLLEKWADEIMANDGLPVRDKIAYRLVAHRWAATPAWVHWRVAVARKIEF